MKRLALVKRLARALLLPALASAAGCTLYVSDELDAARRDLIEGDDDDDDDDGGEGEGEGEEGEGEGEEGEGEEDPLCEDRERLVVITSDPEDPIHVFKLVPGSLLPAVPTGFLAPDGAITTETGDTAGEIDGGVFADGTFFLVDGSRFYAVSSTTLLQVDVRPPEQAVLGGGNYNGVTITDGYVIGVGFGVDALERSGEVAAPPVELPGGGGYHSAVTFVRDGVTYVAANEESGYVVYATQNPAGLPGASQSVDEDTRFSNFGGGQARRGLAYDGVTGSLLLGDEDGLVIPKADNGFALPDVADDWAMPSGSFVTAIGARSGTAFVANGQDVFSVNLSTTPPETTGVAPWDNQETSGIPQAVVVGCKRVVVAIGGFGGPTLISYDRASLDPFGGGAEFPGIIDAFMVDKDALALEGDL